MKKTSWTFVFCLFSLISIYISTLNLGIATESENLLTLDQIQIRDPYIFPWNNTYYMTGTTAEDGFLGFSSTDLVNWKAEGYIYHRNESNYWAQYHFWAPEIKEKDGLFYLFFTGKAANVSRATGVAIASHPLGPYYDYRSDPLTPSEYYCLDGHLFIDDNGSSYFYYVKEWLQATNGTEYGGIGEMWVQPITSDYSSLVGEPILLFHGSDAVWSNIVVDGPCMLKKDGKYYLFWSSYDKRNDGKYCTGYAIADTPTGPFIQSKSPLIDDDGGHCTIFQPFDRNDLKICYHSPNSGALERTQIRELKWNSFLSAWRIIPDDAISIPVRNEIIIIAAISVGGCTLGVIIVKILRKKSNSSPKPPPIR